MLKRLLTQQKTLNNLFKINNLNFYRSKKMSTNFNHLIKYLRFFFFSFNTNKKKKVKMKRFKLIKNYLTNMHIALIS